MSASQTALPSTEASPARQPDEEDPLLARNGTAEGEQTVISDLEVVQVAIILGNAYIGVFLGALDGTIIATLNTAISTSFDSQKLFAWLATAYLMANAACQPISGRLTDIFSRRTGLLVSNALFALGNLMCGLAGSEAVMISGRAVAGMGGGGLMTIGTFLASDLVPLRKRGLVQGLANLAFGSGAGLGGLFGGWVNDNWGWRVAFLIQVPLVTGSAILVYKFVDVPAKSSKKSKLSRVDFLGVFTLMTFVLLLILGLNSGGNIVPWSHPLVFTTLPLSGLALLAFIWNESRWAAEPIIPLGLLLNRTVAGACLANWFIPGACYMIIFYTPVYFQLQGYSTTQTGSSLIPSSVGGATGSLIAGLIMNKTGRYKELGIVLVIVFLLGSSLLLLVSLELPLWPILLSLFLVGIGYGGILTVDLLATISAVDHDYQAVITSASYAFRSTGATIGITVASAVYQNILDRCLWKKLGSLPGAADEIKRIRENFDELHHLPPHWKAEVLNSYVDALRGVFLTVLGAALLGLVAQSFVRQYTLHSTIARK